MTAPMTPEPFRVVDRRRENEDTWTLTLEAPDGAPAAFAPGQFNMLYAFGAGESAISVSGDPAGGGPLVHTIRSVGMTTAALCRSEPGAVIGVRGPFGTAWPVEQAAGRDVVVVTGGIGLAPLRPVLYRLLAERERFGRVVLLYGGRSPELLLFTEELAAWRERGVDVQVSVDTARRGWRGRVGVVSTLIAGAEFDGTSAVAMVCGPEVMMRFTAAALLERGVTADRVHVSLERNMQCGIGHCGHCQLGPTLVCRDGPVYPLAEIGPWMGVRDL